jgi:hypothetical protein
MRPSNDRNIGLFRKTFSSEGGEMNGRNAKIVSVVLCGVFIVVISSCATVPVSIDTHETDSLAIETIVQGKDLEATITDIKTITDKSKETGEISKPDTVKIIEYIDKSKTQVIELNAKLLASEKSRKADNEKMGNIINEQESTISVLENKYHSAKNIMFISIAVNVLFSLCIAGYIMLKLKKLITI